MERDSHNWTWDRCMEMYHCNKCLLEVKHQWSKYWNSKCEESLVEHITNDPTQKITEYAV